MHFTLDDIKKRVDQLALIINAPSDLLPTYGYSRDSAYPHVEVDSSGHMHYVVVERGQELERKTTDQLNDLLYWIFTDVTFSMANDFEMKNRIESQDFRRILFKKQEELLGILSEEWQQKERDAHEKILINHPFTD
ncbi:Imm63 family immunity protein [Spirosoma sp.]|uniref:Imm63 family immunity protein n=1 Tax=Spirosoma sp. TaxID=1899569 RepID=UPI003B3AEBFD